MTIGCLIIFLFSRILLPSIGCHELLKESHIVLGEHSEILDLILQIGDTLDTHSESIALIDVGVYTVGLQHVGVDHTAPQDFYPSRVLAEGTAFTSADVAGNIHFR